MKGDSVVVESLLEGGQIETKLLGVPNQVGTAELGPVLEQQIMHLPELALRPGGQCGFVSK
ncbi:MAG TPA: hypothetical protein VEU11_06155 [Terriglobales bacterium]|nr:hypothetical protein [Terriglobales bacterium]